MDDLTIEMPDFGNIGDFEMPEFTDEELSPRYFLRKQKRVPRRFVVYENAEKLAREIDITGGAVVDAIISGNFVFGDFIEGFILHNKAKCKRVVISTLSMNGDNIDSLAALMEHGWIDAIDIVISSYFYSTERHRGGACSIHVRKARQRRPLPACRMRTTHKSHAFGNLRREENRNKRKRKLAFVSVYGTVHDARVRRAVRFLRRNFRRDNR